MHHCRRWDWFRFLVRRAAPHLEWTLVAGLGIFPTTFTELMMTNFSFLRFSGNNANVHRDQNASEDLREQRRDWPVHILFLLLGLCLLGVVLGFVRNIDMGAHIIAAWFGLITAACAVAGLFYRKELSEIFKSRNQIVKALFVANFLAGGLCITVWAIPALLNWAQDTKPVLVDKEGEDGKSPKTPVSDEPTNGGNREINEEKEQVKEPEVQVPSVRTLTVPQNDTVSIGSGDVHKYERIILEEKSTLRLLGSKTLLCDYLICAKDSKIEYVADYGRDAQQQTIRIVAQNAWGAHENLWIVANGANAQNRTGVGAPGSKGRDAQAGLGGRGARDGDPGGVGAPGNPGRSAPIVEVILNFPDNGNTSPLSALPVKKIESTGGNGGRGQTGGTGGEGGEAQGDRTAAHGGTGGVGGVGGQGGNAAKVTVYFAPADVLNESLVRTFRDSIASQLRPGSGGAGGAGGNGGAGGRGGIIKSGGRPGSNGAAGATGRNGIVPPVTVEVISESRFNDLFRGYAAQL